MLGVLFDGINRYVGNALHGAGGEKDGASASTKNPGSQKSNYVGTKNDKVLLDFAGTVISNSSKRFSGIPLVSEKLKANQPKTPPRVDPFQKHELLKVLIDGSFTYSLEHSGGLSDYMQKAEDSVTNLVDVLKDAKIAYAGKTLLLY
ncbi:hypothetical protein KKA47_00700, partial [bacterium]|nr:hypothetical protein [bacterium]